MVGRLNNTQFVHFAFFGIKKSTHDQASAVPFQIHLNFNWSHCSEWDSSWVCLRLSRFSSACPLFTCYGHCMFLYLFVVTPACLYVSLLWVIAYDLRCVFVCSLAMTSAACSCICSQASFTISGLSSNGVFVIAVQCVMCILVPWSAFQCISVQWSVLFSVHFDALYVSAFQYSDVCALEDVGWNVFATI